MRKKWNVPTVGWEERKGAEHQGTKTILPF